MQRFLIVKTSALGDIVQSFPVIRLLKSKYPEAEIDWVVERPFAELVRAHPDIRRVVIIDSKGWRKAPFRSLSALRASFRTLRAHHYDYVIDLQGNTKSGMVTFCARAPIKIGFGSPALPEWPNRLATTHRYVPEANLSVREEYLNLVAQHFQLEQLEFSEKVLLQLNPEQHKLFETIQSRYLSIKNFRLMVSPGSAWSNKQLTTEALVDLLKRLKQDYPDVQLFFSWGNEAEKLLCQSVAQQVDVQSIVLDRMPLPVLQNVMGNMQLVLSMDSLPLHLAATCGAATYSVFGASSAAKYSPKGELHAAYQGHCPYGRVFEKRCPILRTCQTGSCIREAGVSAAALYADLKRHMEKIKDKRTIKRAFI